MRPYPLELLDKVVDGAAGGAEQAMLAADEGQEDGELEVGQLVDFAEEAVVRHGAGAKDKPRQGTRSMGMPGLALSTGPCDGPGEGVCRTGWARAARGWMG